MLLRLANGETLESGEPPFSIQNLPIPYTAPGGCKSARCDSRRNPKPGAQVAHYARDPIRATTEIS